MAGTLQYFQIRRGQVARAAITRTALPPFAGLASRIGLGENGYEVALSAFEFHGGVVALWEVVVHEAAEFELGRVDGLLLLESLLLEAALFFFLRGGEGADHLGHEVGDAEGGSEEEEERLAAGLCWAGGAVGARTAFETGKGSGCEGRCVCWGRAAGDFGDEGAYPAEEGEDAEDGA